MNINHKPLKLTKPEFFLHLHKAACLNKILTSSAPLCILLPAVTISFTFILVFLVLLKYKSLIAYSLFIEMVLGIIHLQSSLQACCV